MIVPASPGTSRPGVSRRALLGGVLAAGAGAGALVRPVPVLAQDAAAVEGLAVGVGVHHARVGDVAVTVLGDGTLGLGPVTGTVGNAEAPAVEAVLDAVNLAAGPYVTATNVVLLEVGDRRILVDAGSGSSFQPTAGRLTASLALAGIAPESIDTVVLTHLHPDHAWGLLDGDGAIVFPNASYVVYEDEWAFWSDPAAEQAFPEALRFLTDGATRVVEAIEARTERVGDGAEVAPGVTLMAAPGHTPGHAVVAVDSGGERLLVLSDVAIHPIISLARPDWSFAFDFDPAVAAQSRSRILDMAATDRWPVLGFHFPFPGFGAVAPAGEGYWLVASGP